jgi:PLP dependent protein
VTRREQIAAGLDHVRGRIAEACAAAGRRPEEVTLVVVTKTFPASDIRQLADRGVTDIGENKHQEAQAKHTECADLALRWHFVGGLQSNKAAAVAAYADLVHSVDRPKLVTALDKGAGSAGRRVGCLVQVSLDAGEATGRSGVDPQQASDLADRIAEADRLDLLGVMGVAPLEGAPEKAFEKLAEVAEEVRGRHPAASVVSAGMSGDLEAAIACGATHVRVGSAVLGEREVLR